MLKNIKVAKVSVLPTCAVPYSLCIDNGLLTSVSGCLVIDTIGPPTTGPPLHPYHEDEPDAERL